MSEYKFYISRYVNDEWEAPTDLETTFEGLHYLKCDGLSTVGKIKNIYTETYAETSELRVSLPEQVARENTDITFDFLFDGDNRREVYHNFVDWLSGYRLKYYDTLRLRETEMVFMDSIEPSDDEMYGSHVFIKASFKFKNLKGSTEKKEI